jgi:hypothetical protein
MFARMERASLVKRPLFMARKFLIKVIAAIFQLSCDSSQISLIKRKRNERVGERKIKMRQRQRKLGKMREREIEGEREKKERTEVREQSTKKDKEIMERG